MRNKQAKTSTETTEHTRVQSESFVSRETGQDIEKYKELLKKWQRTINLVGKKMTDVELEIHIQEAIEMVSIFPHTKKWLDLGSGSGLPAIIIGLTFKNMPSSKCSIELIESDQRKAAFLREAIREINISGCVKTARIENTIEKCETEIISAKALADLKTLTKWVMPLLKSGAIAIFPKGPRVFEEIRDVPALSGLKIELRPQTKRSNHYFVILKYQQ